MEQRGPRRDHPPNPVSSFSCHLSRGDEHGGSSFLSVLLLMQNEKQCVFRQENGTKKKKGPLACFRIICGIIQLKV